MAGIIVRTLICMLGLFLASALLPGVSIEGTGTFILAALLLGLANGFIRPIAIVLTLPLTIVTLGLFILVINAAMFGLVAALLDDFTVAGLFSAMFGALWAPVRLIQSAWADGTKIKMTSKKLK